MRATRSLRSGAAQAINSGATNQDESEDAVRIASDW
jgi:hypothetical protein